MYSNKNEESSDQAEMEKNQVRAGGHREGPFEEWRFHGSVKGDEPGREQEGAIQGEAAACPLSWQKPWEGTWLAQELQGSQQGWSQGSQMRGREEVEALSRKCP